MLTIELDIRRPVCSSQTHLLEQNDSGNIEHLKYLCLLDFYVESSVQRQGYGKILLDTMISREPTLESVKDLCVDRPTENCLTLLQKYYNVKPIRVVIDEQLAIAATTIR
ncbi:hypothetical protein NQZ79_g3225 [Umbelopsis isabellina]|nr:hypothetical protein NQZ79_g3225 [Umbelopsis isabellina]